MTIHFFVPGTAKPAGSKSAFPYAKASGSLGVRVADQSGKKGKLWRVAVQVHAKNAHVGKPLIPHDTPIKIEMVFFRPRPKNHFRADGSLKVEFADLTPTQRPDVLKLARAVEDALTGIIYEDDSSIIEEHLFKRYASSLSTPGTPPGVAVTITY